MFSPSVAELFFFVFFIHLKLELLTQFPSSNEWNIFISLKNKYLQYWIIEKNYFKRFSVISIDLKHDWSRIYKGLAGQGFNK